jgi:6-phosphogluconolactonase
MTHPPEVVVHHDGDVLAAAVAARLLTRLVDAQSSGRVPSVVLTGGGIARKVSGAIRSSPARSAVDWSRLDVWWGDERYVPADDGERNEAQARSDLLDHLSLDPDRVHPMAASDGPFGSDVEAAAADYGDQLAAAARPEDHGDVPVFDVLMLGMGPDGHVASLFPDHPARYDERSVVAVRGAPKPPPTRISMTFPTLARGREVWFLVTGAEKAKATRLALGGAGPLQVPAAGPRGLDRTLWMLDDAAAGQLPPDFRRPASP